MPRDSSLDRRRFIRASGLTATGLAAGCLDALGSGSDGDGSDEGPITLGGTLPLSGPYAETGQYARDGYQQWRDDINAEDGLLGRDVELVIEDDQSEPSEGVSLLQRLINQEDVDLLLGGYPGSTAAAQMQVADEHDMVYVSMGGHMSSFEQGFEYTFGGPPLMGEWWYDGFFDWLETQPEGDRPERAAVITVNNPVGDAVRTSSIEGIESLGMELVLDEKYALPLDSPQSLVSSAQDADADLFVANGFFDDGVQTIRAIHNVGYQPKAVLQGIGSLTPAWEDELGDLGNHVVSGTSMHPDLPFEGVDHLNDVARDEYSRNSAPPYFMFGYAWLQTLGQGVEGAGNLDQAEIRDWLHENCVRTVGGEYCFDDRGVPEEPIDYVTQVRDGTARLVWPDDVKTHDIAYPYHDQF